MEDNYAVKRKLPSGKYYSDGSVKKNKWGNYQLGMKATAALKELVANTKEGDWLNWSLFADDGQREQAKPRNPLPKDEIPW